MSALALIGELVLVGLAVVLLRRLASGGWRTRLTFVLKAYLTVRVMALIVFHEVEGVTVYEVLRSRLQDLDAWTFVAFTLAATLIKLLGIGASVTRWILMLRGQGIQLPVRHIVGAFFTGRFLGTFLPSTLGLDGYKLYDASRFSGRTVEATAATALEKVIGVSGIFLTFLVAAPFGIQIFEENAAVVAMTAIPISVGIIGGLMTVLFFPGLIQWVLTHVPIPGKARLEGLVLRIAHAAAAYRDKKGLIVQAFCLSFVVHFTTAAMYFFTALAIGATQAEFWPVVFGSSIQILATVISPFTIAGEGIREAAQY
ncbi:MAG: lysylphosphatidylglycerol synthase transmembrane domain-containing protein, partial [Myxococcota bacterium]